MHIAKKLKFPEINKLKVKLIGDMDQYNEYKDLETMLQKSFTQPLKYLHLGGGNYASLHKYRDGLKKILPLITDQIYLVSFVIDGKTLRKIIKYARNAKALVLCDCKIHFSTYFKTYPEVEYKMETLDLFSTCDKNDHEKLDRKKLDKFVTELGKCQLTKTLKHVHVHSCVYSKGDVHDIFHKNGFKAKII